jgi:hypothetical protein
MARGAPDSADGGLRGAVRACLRWPAGWCGLGRRLPPEVPAKPEMPAKLRRFDPVEWGAPGDASSEEVGAARDRFCEAWVTWCDLHSVSPLAVLLEQRRVRAKLGVDSDEQTRRAAK